MPREDGEFDINLLKRQLESSLTANISLAKENEELRQEVSRLKAQISTTLRPQNNNNNSISNQRPTLLNNQSGNNIMVEKQQSTVPNTPPNPPPFFREDVINVLSPPPPPPLPSKALVGAKAVRRVPEVVELFRSLTRKDAQSETNTSSAAKGPPLELTRNMIGEIENRSTYISAVKSEVENQAEFINFLIKEVESAAHEKISDVEEFVNWVDEQLSMLVDERAVLKHFPRWPEQKADTLREAAFNYRDLRSLRFEAFNFEDNPKETLSQTTRRVQELQERLERSVSNVERTRESASKRYQDFMIPWDWMMDTGLIGEMKLSSLRLAQVFIRRVTGQMHTGEHTRDKNLLLQGVRFAYRVHQFAGGFDTQTLQAFQELKRLGQVDATKLLIL